MKLSEKMFTRSTKACPVRTDCRAETDQKYVEDLFADEWEVFVIKRDEKNDRFDWFTLCCESANEKSYAQ